MEPRVIPIVINGFPRVGKDEVVLMAQEHAKRYNFSVHNVSSVDPAKQALTILGWTGRKDSESRRVLSDLKELSTRLYDGPHYYMTSYLRNAKHNSMVFFHIREPSNIQRFVEATGALTLLVESNRAEVNHDNKSDQEVLQYNYGFQIQNNGTLDELSQNVKIFVDEIVDEIVELKI